MREIKPRVAALTGGTGFVGHRIAQHLLADNWQVKALVRSSWPTPAPQGLTIVRGSLEDRPSLDTLVEDTIAVIHCAGAVRARAEEDFQRINVVGAGRLAEAAGEAYSQPLFLHISSLSARAPELSPYAASKRASEKIIADKLGGLAWIILRPTAVYGPGDRATLSIFRPISKGIAPIMGSYENRVSLIYVDDLAAAVVAILATPPPSGSVFEVSDGTFGGYTWQRIGETAAQCLKKNIFYLRIPRLIMQIAAVANVGASRLIGTTPIMTQGKVRELFHPNWACQGNPLADSTSWWPRIGIDEGFAKTLAWYRDQGWI